MSTPNDDVFPASSTAYDSEMEQSSVDDETFTVEADAAHPSYVDTLSNSLDSDIRTAVGSSITANVHVISQHGGTAVGAIIQVKGAVPLEEIPVHSDYLLDVQAHYATPTGFDRLRYEAEMQNFIMVFDISEGRGRTIHAEALAASLRSAHFASTNHPEHDESVWRPNANPFDVARLMFGGSAHFPYTRMPNRNRRIWILEIPTDEEGYQVDSSFWTCLQAVEDFLRANDSRLLILTRPEQWTRIGGPNLSQWASVRSRLADVSPLEIAHAYLRGRNPELTLDRWFQNPDIAAMFERATTTETIELATLILATAETPAGMLPQYRMDGSPSAGTETPDQDIFSLRIQTVLESRKQWRPQLRQWHSAPTRTSFDRDFQLTAATMAGLPVSHIYIAAAQLGRTLGAESTNVKGQSAPGVIQMLHTIGADLTSDDRIEFPRARWEDAVLEYFWVDRPLARREFVAWLASAPSFDPKEALEPVTERQRHDVARRIVRFAVRWAGRQSRDLPLRELATAWRNGRYWQDLIEILSDVAAAHESDADTHSLIEYRSYVHAMLLTWARHGDPGLAHAVLAICDGPFSSRFTSKALVRLKHAGYHLDADTRTTLVSTIRRLWREPSTRSTLTSEVAAWCTDSRYGEIGSLAFAVLAGATIEDSDGKLALTTLTVDYAPNRIEISQCWGTYLRVTDRGACGYLVRQWLDAAMSHAEQREEVLSILRSAVAGSKGSDGRSREKLRVATYDWSEVDPKPGKNDIYLHLTGMLDQDLRTEMHALIADTGRDSL